MTRLLLLRAQTVILLLLLTGPVSTIHDMIDTADVFDSDDSSGNAETAVDNTLMQNCLFLLMASPAYHLCWELYQLNLEQQVGETCRLLLVRAECEVGQMMSACGTLAAASVFVPLYHRGNNHKCPLSPWQQLRRRIARHDQSLGIVQYSQQCPPILVTAMNGCYTTYIGRGPRLRYYSRSQLPKVGRLRHICQQYHRFSACIQGVAGWCPKLIHLWHQQVLAVFDTDMYIHVLKRQLLCGDHYDVLLHSSRCYNRLQQQQQHRVDWCDRRFLTPLIPLLQKSDMAYLIYCQPENSMSQEVHRLLKGCLACYSKALNAVCTVEEAQATLHFLRGTFYDPVNLNLKYRPDCNLLNAPTTKATVLPTVNAATLNNTEIVIENAYVPSVQVLPNNNSRMEVAKTSVMNANGSSTSSPVPMTSTSPTLRTTMSGIHKSTSQSRTHKPTVRQASRTTPSKTSTRNPTISSMSRSTISRSSSALLYETDMYLQTLDILQDRNPDYLWLSDAPASTAGHEPKKHDERTEVKEEDDSEYYDDDDDDSDDDYDGDEQSGYGRLKTDTYAVDMDDWHTSSATMGTSIKIQLLPLLLICQVYTHWQI